MSDITDEGCPRKKYCCRDLAGGIRNRGLRMTIPRQLVAESLERAGSYLSAEDIYNEIKEDYPAIGLATVYRTLVLLEEIGAVSRTDFSDGRARYIPADIHNADHSHQLICEKCYRVIKYSDFTDEELSLYGNIERDLSRKYGFEIKRHVVQFYGLCPVCMEENQNEGSSSNRQ